MLLAGTDWTKVTATQRVSSWPSPLRWRCAIFAEALAQGCDWAAMGSSHPFAASADAAGPAQAQ
jgi:hypothetical protein